MSRNMDRRSFMRKAAAALASPLLLPAAVRGADGHVAPSNRIVVGVAGMGVMGTGNLRRALVQQDVQVVALCDVDAEHLARARRIVDQRYGNHDCAGYADLYEMLGRGDLDAVVLAMPDHWHALAAIAALRAGLDVYGEKPIAHGLREGRAICNAVTRYGRVFQTGSQMRSFPFVQQGVELVRNGRLGHVRHVEIAMNGGEPEYRSEPREQLTSAPPAQLDYDRWLGPAPWSPYRAARLHRRWRRVLDYGGGLLMDFIGHYGDIAGWSLGLDRTGPVEVSGRGQFLSGLYDAPLNYQVDLRYASGLTMRLTDGPALIRWDGERGTLFMDRTRVWSDPAWIVNEPIGANEVRVGRGRDHMRDFIDSVRSRAQPAAPAEVGHRAASLGQLGMTAMLTGRKLRWDPVREEVIGDPGANAMLGHAWRTPWLA